MFKNLRRHFFFNSNSMRLRIIAVHHKTGTSLLYKIFNNISQKFLLKLYYGKQNKLPSNTVFWMEDHSRFDFESINLEIIGIHIIRHPYSVIFSGYNYHKSCKEEWCLKPMEKYQGKSYQEQLNSLNEEDGILLEMQSIGYRTIMDMYKWNYDDKRFLELKFENLINDFDNSILDIFRYMEIREIFHRPLLKLVQRYNLKNVSKKQLMKNDHVTNKALSEKPYLNSFKERHYSTFRSLFPEDVFEKLGY